MARITPGPPPIGPSPAAAGGRSFPPGILPANPAAVLSVTAAPDEATLPHKLADGTAISLATLAQVDRDAYFAGGGKPFVANWPGNGVGVVKAGVQQNDIGISSWSFGVVTNATWMLLRGNFVFGSTAMLSRMVRVNGVQVTPRTVGQAVAMVPGAFGGIVIDFRDASYKSVEVFSSGQLRSCVTNTGAAVSAFTQPGRKKLYVLGDSWVGGTDQASPAGSWARVLQHSVPWDVSYNGQGGTGYVAGTANAWQCKFGDSRRVAAITEWAPDLVLISGSINDNGASAAAVQSGATALYSALATALPAAKLIVVGPQLGDGTNPANATALQTAAAGATNVLGYVNPVTEGWNRSGALGPTDLIHPSVLGAEWYARLAEDTVRRLTAAAGDASW